jgi:hypothetical protein
LHGPGQEAHEKRGCLIDAAMAFDEGNDLRRPADIDEQ